MRPWEEGGKEWVIRALHPEATSLPMAGVFQVKESSCGAK